MKVKPKRDDNQIKEKIKILWITDVTSNGRGDYDYLQEISNESYLEKLGLQLDQVEIVRVVCVPQNNDTLIAESAREKLRRGEKLAITLDEIKINQSAEKVRVVLYNPQKRNRTEKLESVFNESTYAHADYFICVSSEGVSREIATYKRMYNDVISYFIGAHASDLSLVMLDKKHKYKIGLENGFLMTSIVSPSKLDRIKSLSSFEDKEYLSSLIGEQSPEAFIENTLFVPAYFQDKYIAKIFIKSILKSNLDNEYSNGITFHLSLHDHVKRAGFYSPEAIWSSLFNDEIIQFLVKKGYTEITIDGFLYDHISHSQLNHKISEQLPPKKLRIIANQWMKNKADFHLLFSIAQIIAGTSGDNTLNNALAKGVIPFYTTQPWNKNFKEKFIEGIANQLFKLGDDEIINKIKSLLDTIMPEIEELMDASEDINKILDERITILSDKLSRAKDTGLFDILKDIIKNIQENKNFDCIMKKQIIAPINIQIQELESGKSKRMST